MAEIQQTNSKYSIYFTSHYGASGESLMLHVWNSDNAEDRNSPVLMIMDADVHYRYPARLFALDATGLSNSLLEVQAISLDEEALQEEYGLPLPEPVEGVICELVKAASEGGTDLNITLANRLIHFLGFEYIDLRDYI